MNDKEIYKGIAWGLKTLLNAALELIRDGRLEEAKKMYENAGHTSTLFGYREGIGMSLLSLANLELLRNDLVLALQNAAGSLEYFTAEDDVTRASELVKSISLHLIKDGITKEADGEKQKALEIFELALPYLNGKRKEAVNYEIGLLRRQMDID